MYICEEHGEICSNWCEECEEVLDCNHENQTYTRIKDIIYDCEEGERTVTIRIHHCETCGDIRYID